MRLAARTLLFTLLYPGTVCVLLPWLVLWFFEPAARPMFDGVAWVGVGLVLGGAAIYVWCALDFGVRGRGTPAPYDPPRALVVTGLYRYSRNPMYVGIVSILLGESALFHSPALLSYAAAVTVGFHLRVVVYEEPTLRRLFGEAFEQYRRSAPRWLGRPRRPA